MGQRPGRHAHRGPVRRWRGGDDRRRHRRRRPSRAEPRRSGLCSTPCPRPSSRSRDGDRDRERRGHHEVLSGVLSAAQSASLAAAVAIVVAAIVIAATVGVNVGQPRPAARQAGRGHRAVPPAGQRRPAVADALHQRQDHAVRPVRRRRLARPAARREVRQRAGQPGLAQRLRQHAGPAVPRRDLREPPAALPEPGAGAARVSERPALRGQGRRRRQLRVTHDHPGHPRWRVAGQRPGRCEQLVRGPGPQRRTGPVPLDRLHRLARPHEPRPPRADG